MVACRGQGWGQGYIQGTYLVRVHMLPREYWVADWRYDE